MWRVRTWPAKATPPKIAIGLVMPCSERVLFWVKQGKRKWILGVRELCKYVEGANMARERNPRRTRRGFS